LNPWGSCPSNKHELTSHWLLSLAVVSVQVEAQLLTVQAFYADRRMHAQEMRGLLLGALPAVGSGSPKGALEGALTDLVERVLEGSVSGASGEVVARKLQRVRAGLWSAVHQATATVEAGMVAVHTQLLLGLGACYRPLEVLGWCGLAMEDALVAAAEEYHSE